VGSGEAALKYLAAYLCRPPLHESQVERWDEQSVTGCCRENDGDQKSCTVSVFEFVRRFLQHACPRASSGCATMAGAGPPTPGTKWERILALLDWKCLERIKPQATRTPLDGFDAPLRSIPSFGG
jgi:hypothetical protein